MAGFSIDIFSNVRDVQRGAGDVEDAFEKVADSLDDVTRASDKTGDMLGDSIKDGSKEGTAALDKLERSFKDIADTAKREGSDAGDSIGRGVKKGSAEASESVKTFKEEARQNADEVASSFDGSAQSIADGFQSVAATAFSGFGPAGVIAGYAAAAGIGLVSSAFDQAGTNSEAFQAKVSALASELIETGKEGEVSLDFIGQRLQDLATGANDGEASLKDLRKAADNSGSSFKDLTDAYAGNSKGLDDLIQRGKDLQRSMEDELHGLDNSTDAGSKRTKQLTEQINAQIDYNNYLSQSKTAADEAAKAEQNFADAGGYAIKAQSEALDEYATKTQDALTETGEAWEDYTHDGIVSLDEYNAAIEKQVQAIAAYQENMVQASATLSEEALNYIRSLGPEAAPLLQAYVDAPLEQKQRTAANWGVLGAAAADSYTANLKAQIPSEIQGPAIKVSGDFSDFEWQLAQFTQKTYNVGVGVLLRPGSPTD
ncbi:hypothetical protein VD659_16220 [Herbiconiux sp. 11R-BC]|uniref:hypothetical protein n=1 Tax=Herbiconiux sp. 11R-BC TaxID=3111637 RepID=UPI003BFB7E20